MEVVTEFIYQRGKSIDGGRGRNSTGVFLAHDPQRGAQIAVKEIAKADLDAKNYFQEAQRVQSSGHPNVVPIHTACATADHVALGMPYYKNGCLAQKIENGPLPLVDAVRFTREALLGLGAIHAAGLVHFDIKPSNILISDSGTAVLADFGQSQELGPDGITVQTGQLYMPGMPPESVSNGQKGSCESDIYQMGLTLYRLLNGEPAFTEEMQLAATSRAELLQKIASGKFPSRGRFYPHVPRQLRRIVQKAMNVEPQKRYSQANEFVEALAAVNPSNNWFVETMPGGHVTWRADNPKSSNLQVELRESSGAWSVKAFTVNGGAARKHRKVDPRTGLQKDDAQKRLKEVFQLLD